MAHNDQMADPFVRDIPEAPNLSRTQHVLIEVQQERARQDEEWGGPSHDDLHDALEWITYIDKHRDLALVAAHQVGMSDEDGEAEEYAAQYRDRLIKIAALGVAAIESLDRVMERRFAQERYDEQESERRAAGL